MRAAVVIEQCWHRVPGGTATRRARPGGGGRGHRSRRAGRRGRPPRRAAARAVRGQPSPSATCRCPAPALYEAWHRLAAPGRRAGHRARRRRPRHRLAIPPRTAPLVVTLHDLACRRDPSMFTRHGVRFFERGACAACWTTPTWCCARRRRRSTTASPPASTRTRLRLVPWGMTHGRRVRRRRRRRSARALRPHRPLRAVGRHARAPQEPAPPARGVRPPAAATTSRWCSSAPTGWGEALGARGRRRLRRPAPAARLRPPSTSSARSTPAPRWSATRACGRASACRCSRPWRRARRSSPRRAPRPRMVAGDAGLLVDPRDVDAIAGGAGRRCSTTTTSPTACGAARAGSGPPVHDLGGDRGRATIAAYEEVLRDR